LTRSGVVQSVHSFARSDIGYYFLGFLLLTLIVSWALIYWRRNELKSSNVFESFLSKEFAFVVNNVLLVGSAFFILYATLFPTFSELITGKRIIIGPPFFNEHLAYLAIGLLVLTGIGPMIGWKKASKENLRRSFVWPTIVGTICTGALALLGMFDWYVLGTGFGVGFVVTTLIMEFFAGAHARMIQFGESWSTAAIRATLINNRKYGGYVVHLGLVLIFAGIAGAVYKKIYEFDMKPGDVQYVEEYTVRFKGIQQFDRPNQVETFGILDFYIGDKLVQEMRPARFFYKAQEQPSTEVDIYSRLKEDVYFTLGSIDPQTQVTKIHITLNPLISLLWIGGFVLVLGAVISMMPSLSLRRRD